MLLNLWIKCLNHLQNTIPRQQFIKYISPLQIKIIKNIIIIFAPNYYILDKITNYYFSIIENSINIISNKKYKIEIKIGPNTVETEDTNLNNPKEFKNNLNPEFTFENFIESKSNKHIKLLSFEIINNLGKKYNPLYVYSEHGYGKSHLLNAIGNEIVKNNKYINITYNKTEKFVNEMIIAIKKYNMSDFKNNYRNKDVIILDDIQFLAKKKKIQEEFFYTINSLIENKKQVIISSNKHIKNIKNINKNLKSIVLSGALIKIKKTDVSSRKIILTNKMKKLHLKINDEILNFIAKNMDSNIRELESIINEININKSINKNKITISYIKKIILKRTNKKKKREISIKDIVHHVANFYNIKLEAINSKKRNKTIVFARQIIFYLSKIMTNKSLSEIGEELFKYNHTTVLYSYKKILNLAKTNKIIKNDIKLIMNLINK